MMSATAQSHSAISYGNATKKVRKDRIDSGIPDPVIKLYDKLLKLEIEISLLDSALEEISQRAPGEGFENVYEAPCIECCFPEYKGLPQHGMTHGVVKKISSLAEAKKAACELNAIASYYGKAEIQEAKELGIKWAQQITDAHIKLNDFKDKSGFTGIYEKSCALENDAHHLRERIYRTKATTLEGVLLQVREMRQYIHGYSWMKTGKWMETIAAGLEAVSSENIGSKAS